jgi:hypothetical protein
MVFLFFCLKISKKKKKKKLKDDCHTLSSLFHWGCRAFNSLLLVVVTLLLFLLLFGAIYNKNDPNSDLA